MPETPERIDGWIAVSDIILHRNGAVITDILSCVFLSLFIIYLTVKSLLTDFAIFFFLFFFFY